MGGGAAVTETPYTVKPLPNTALASFAFADELELAVTLGDGGVAGVTRVGAGAAAVTTVGAGAAAANVADEEEDVLATTVGELATTVALGAGALAITVTVGIGGGGRLASNATLGARIAPWA